MDWNNLHFLLVVSRSSTMTEAGARLGVAQTTVARRLDTLEETLGVQLVERRRDGVSLTEEGAEAVRLAEQMEDLTLTLERSVLNGNERLSGKVTITTIDMITAYHPDLFADFSKAYPNIEVGVVTGYKLRSLARREADIALRFTMSPAEHLYGRRLVRCEYAVYGTRELVKVHGTDVKKEAYPWLSWYESSGARMIKWMKNNAPQATIVCRYDAVLSLHAAAKAGAGVTFLPCIYGDADPTLVRLLGPVDEFGYDLWVLTHPDLARTARIKAFLHYAGEYFDARKSAFTGST